MFGVTGKSVALLVLLCVATIWSDVKIVKKENLKLSLGIDAAFNGEINYREVEAGFVVDAAQISLSSVYKKRLKLFLSIDPSKPNSSSKSGYTKPLEKLYLQWQTKRNLRIRAGQFKLPFGHEEFQSLEERALITHRKSTREIAPGLDRGIMFYGKEVGGWFTYYTGVFNGTSVEQSLNSITLLLPVKVQLSKEFDRFHLTAGYNSYFRTHYPYNWNLKYRWANGIFTELNIKTTKDNRLTFLAEFLEKLDFRDLKSSQKPWELGGFLIASYRKGNIEPVLFGELYNRDVTVDDLGDKQLFGAGLNVHFFEDHLRMSVQLEYERLPYGEEDNIIALLSLRGFL